MATDPRPNTARRPNGEPDLDLERRFLTIFAALGSPSSPRPTDAASALVFIQELHDRLTRGNG